MIIKCKMCGGDLDITADEKIIEFCDLTNDKCYNDDRDDESFLERDFNKIYKDVSRKETDENKIYLKIKQKLYQKGYKLEQIDRIINEKRN